MGFYSVSQLVQDVRRHGVEVRPVDVNRSDRDCSLERRADGQPALRLGLRMVKGLCDAASRRIVERRADGGYRSIPELLERCELNRKDSEALAAAGAMKSLDGHRHQVRWTVAGVEKPTALFPSMEQYEATPMLKRPSEGQNIVADYRSLGLSLERHPIELLRPRLDRYGYLAAAGLPAVPSGQRVRVAGLVITKQRPGTASGVIFVTLEDETGHINLVVWKKIAEEQRTALLQARLLGIDGDLQIEGKVIHVIVRKMIDHTSLLGELQVTSRNFR
jgi:error-prone DNA polymerase